MAINGDTKVILHRLDQLGNQVGRLEVKQEKWHETSAERLRQSELQTALLEQSQENIRGDIEKIEDKQKKNDLWTKFLGGATGLLTLVLTYLGLKG